MPDLPARTPRDKGGDGRSARPYTRMAACGLAAGLTWRDMRHMKYTHLMQLLWEWDEMHGAEYDEVVNATSDDVLALSRL